MKKPNSKLRFAVIAIICLVFIISLVSYSVSQSQAKISSSFFATRPANCVPLPWLNKTTATIMPSSRQLLETPGLIDKIPTVSQHKITNTFDLRPDLPQSSKLMVFVFKCDGTEDLYLVDPQTYNTGNAIPLNPGDVIMGVTSPSDMYYHGPAPTRSSLYLTTNTSTSAIPKEVTLPLLPKLTVTLTPSNAPYPGPNTSTPKIRPTTSSYPPPPTAIP